MPSGVASKTYGWNLSKVSSMQRPLNTIAQTLDYDITEVESGPVVITAEPTETQLNPAGTLHGGFFRPRCSIAAWDWRSCRLWKKGSARRLSNSRFHLCDPSPLRRA